MTPPPSTKAVFFQACRIFLPLSLLAIITLGLTCRYELGVQREALQEEEAAFISVAKWVLEDQLSSIAIDVHGLAALPTLQRFIDAPGLDTQRALEESLVRFGEATQVFERIEVYGPAGENVRVVLGESGTILLPAAAPDLDHPYVQRALALEAGQLFISPIELNGTGAEPAGAPPKPVVRMGQPLFGATANTKGALILVYRVDGMIDHIAQLGQSSTGCCTLLNSEGYWLHNPDPSKEWGFEREGGENDTFGNAYPEAWERMQAGNSGQFESDAGLVTYSATHAIDEDEIQFRHLSETAVGQPLWYIVDLISDADWLAMTWGLRRFLVVICILVCIGFAGLSWLLARTRLQRERALGDLRKSEALYRALAQNFPDGAVMLFDDELNCLLAEGTGLPLMGLPDATLSGKALWDIFPPEVSSHLQHLRQQSRAGHSEHFEIELAGRIFQAYLVPIRGPEGQIYNEMVMTHDVSEQKQLESELRIAATVDGLTGLFNRRHFLERLEDFMRVAKRYEQPLSLCVCDVDFFKTVNDTYGHVSGDKALVAMGSLIRREIRATDVAARYGGDEFCIAFVNTRAADAVNVLERIRAGLAVQAIQTEDGASFQITGSFGVASLPADAETVEDFFAAADRALYKAKAAGRNQVAQSGSADE